MELFFHWCRYVLIMWGLIYLVTQSSILFPFRVLVLRLSLFLGGLVFCPACSGFWLGLGVGFLGIYGPPLAPLSHPAGESAVIATVLGHLWGSYFGDPYQFEKAFHALGLKNAESKHGEV